MRVLCSRSSVLLLVAVSLSLLPTIAVTQQPSPAPTPSSTDCFAWVDRCTGEHHCTSNSSTPAPPPSCHPLIPTDLTPAPGVCTLNNGSCQFVDPCATWNKQCFGTDYQCTTKEQYQYHNCSSFYQPNPAPPPKEKCLAINGTCQQYNPCRKWAGFCNGPYQCITDVEYYQYTHGPQPGCPAPQNTPQPPHIPPGECIYQNGQCVWSNCTAWFDVCTSTTWSCTTDYDLEAHDSLPPPPCPPPPYPSPGSYLPQPGPCNYNITSQKCNYILNVTHPCESAMCPHTSTCEIYAPTNTAYCQVQCSINNGGCGEKLKCKLVNVTCYPDSQPCPFVVHCIDPCAGLNCSVGSQCMVDQPSGTGYCAPSCDLDNGGCTADQQCVLEHVQCITSPCPPIVQCVQACNQWMDRCTGEHHCTSNSMVTPPPSCHPMLPPDFTPAPGVCTFTNGTCQFVNPCITWNNDCNYGADYQCIARKNHQPQNCSYYQQPPPPPKDECFPINGTCQQYNPCRKWAGFCNGPYQCLTDVEYYKKMHGPQPICLPNTPEQPPLPPGECIYQRGQCVWSNCTSSLDQCGQFWECQSHYDYQNDQSRPPHPCPFPGPGFTLPPQPGPCQYKLSSQMCQYFTKTDQPCSTAICPTGRVCQVYSPTNTTYCQPHCDIDNGGCKTAELCSLVNQTCFPNRPCPPKVVCKLDPCATIRCQDGYQCKIDGPTGNGYCDPSCDLNNGGCPVDAQCALIPVQCITTPCPPTVRCDTDTCSDCTGKCVTRNSTEPAQCLPSCFVSNGGCRSDQICTSIPAPECSTGPQYCTSVPTSLQCSNVNDFNGRCVPGMEYSVCSSLCEPTCDSYLSNDLIVCPLICVQGCVCPAGLIRYRDHCVSPLECTSLLNNPPPIDPLPQPSDTLLIGFTLTNTTVAQFKRTVRYFGFKLKQLLFNNGINDAYVDLYTAIQDQGNKRDSDTSTEIFVVMSIRSSTIGQGMTGDEMVDIIQENIAALDAPVTALSTVNSRYGNIGGSVLSPAVIGGIVSGVVVVLIALIVLVIVILVLVGRAYYRRKPKQCSLEDIGSYSKLKGVLSSGEPD